MTDEERKQFINEYCRNVGNIKIRCDDCKFVENCVDYGWDGCKKFTPTPSEPMTNKEYYTETDEELAGFLSRTCQDLLASVVEDGGSVPNEYIEEDRGFWLKWLKEIHK